MASLMKSVDVIQEVKILPWAKPSQQPGSEARWPEETKVRSRVDRVDGVCIEPRKLFESCGPERDKPSRDVGFVLCEPRTVSPCWNAISCRAPQASTARGHRGLRPDHADKGITRELTRASSVSCLQHRGSRGSPPRDQSSDTERLAAPPGRSSMLKRGDDRYEGTSRMAKEPRMDVRQS
jgi:hypothetical protein